MTRGSLAMTLPNSVIASEAKQSPGWPLLMGGRKAKMEFLMVS